MLQNNVDHEELQLVPHALGYTREQLQHDLPELSRVLSSPQHPISRHIQRYLIEQEAQPVSNLKFYLQRGSVILVGILGALSGVPWADPAYKMAGKNHELGIFLAADTILVFGLGACWVWTQVLNDLFYEPSAEEKELIPAFCTPHGACSTLLRNIFSLMTAVPSAYTAYKYNTVKLLALVVFVDTYAFSTLGFKYMADSYGKLKTYFGHARPPIALEKELTNVLIKKVYARYLDQSPEYRAQFLGSLAMELGREGIQGPAAVYLQHLFSVSPSIVEQLLHHGHRPTAESKKLEYFLIGASLSICAINFAANIIMSDEGASDFITPNEGVAITISILTSLPGLALRMLSSMDTIYELSEYRAHRERGGKDKSFTEAFYPRSALIIPVLAVLFAIPTSAAQSHILIDVFSATGGFAYLFTVMSGIQEIVYESFLLRKLGNLAVEKRSDSYSENPEIRQALSFSKQLNSLAIAVQKIPDSPLENPAIHQPRGRWNLCTRFYQWLTGGNAADYNHAPDEL